jgi:DNA-binding response OmpR family regulator
MPHSIMLVDDDRDLRTLMGLILKREDYAILEAGSGDSAIKMLTAHIPDLFILDIMMPGMNGYELCRHLKSNEATAHLPVILLSARSDETSMFEGLEAGADLYLVKPIPTNDLIVRIQQFLPVEIPQD